MSYLNKMKIAVSGVQELFAGLTGSYFGIIPNNSISNFTLTRASTATRINKSGNIEVVPANKGRIDYSLGTDKCPNLLVERSVVNLVPNILAYGASAGTLTTLIAGSPISGVNCARIVKNEAAGTIRYVPQLASATTLIGATTYTYKSYFKYDGIDLETTMESNAFPEWNLGVNWRIVINIASTGVTLGTATNCTAYIEYFGNGWYKVVATILTGAAPSNFPTILYRLPAVLGSGQGFLHAAPQLTAGSIDLASIITSGVAVTKNADVITKTGLSSLIPQTKGCLLFDGYLQAGSLSDNTSYGLLATHTDLNNRILLYRYNNLIYIIVSTGGVSQFDTTYTILAPFKNKRIKISFYYELNNCQLYINGTLIATDTSCTIPAMSNINVGSSQSGGLQWDGLIKMAGVADELTATERDQFFQYDTFEEMASEMLYTIDDATNIT